MKVAIFNKILLALSFVGIFFAGALSFSKHSGAALECGKSTGCADVAAYVASNWGNFPVADTGLAAYIVLAVLALMRSMKGFSPSQLKPTVVMTLVGSLLSVGLTAYAFAVIKASCLYCVGSAVTMTLMFIIAFLAMNEKEPAPADQALTTWGLAGLFLISSMAGITYSSAKKDTPNLPTTIEGLIPAKPHSLGSENAEVVVVEFYDLFCQYCRANYKETKDMVRQNDGKLRFVFRHFPLAMLEGHQYTQVAMFLSEIAAEKGKYFQFIEKLFELDRTTTTPDQMFGIMTTLGFKESEVRARTNDSSDPALARLYEDIVMANKMALDTTPTYFIARKGLAPNAYTNRNFRPALAKLGIK